MKTDTIYPYYLSYLEERLRDGKISKGSLNSKEELEYLLSNVDLIAKNALEQLSKMRSSRRVYAFEDFLPADVQLNRTDISIVDES